MVHNFTFIKFTPNRRPILLMICWFLFNLPAVNAQVQMGSDIDGTNSGDHFGEAVSMGDSVTVAIGAHLSDGSGFDAGQVQVFRWNGSNWQQKGGNIDGEVAGDQSGLRLDMADANTVAISASRNDIYKINAGQVRVFAWDGNDWKQKGNSFYGSDSNDYIASALCMPDSNTIAIGSQNGDSLRGYGRVYTWDGSVWKQKGTDLIGEAIGDQAGQVSMPDANTIALGAFYNDAGGEDAGHVRIFKWRDTSWVQKGAAILGEAPGDNSGRVSMPDSNTIAICATQNDDAGQNAGHVRVYKWNGNNWVQLGQDLDGNYASDYFGASVSMPDSVTVAVGAPNNDDNGNNSGLAKIFTWDGSSWIQRCATIYGEASGDASGWVSMADASTVAIGGHLNDAGRVRIFNNLHRNAGNSEFGNEPDETIIVYPNPTAGDVTIQVARPDNTFEVKVRNIAGQTISAESFQNSQFHTIQITSEPGLYFLEISCNQKLQKVFKVTKTR